MGNLLGGCLTVKNYWIHLIEYLGTNETNYFMYWWGAQWAPLPPLYSSSGISCISTNPVFGSDHRHLAETTFTVFVTPWPGLTTMWSMRDFHSFSFLSPFSLDNSQSNGVRLNAKTGSNSEETETWTGGEILPSSTCTRVMFSGQGWSWIQEWPSPCR